MAADVAQALRQGNAKLAKGKWEEAEGSFAHGLRLSEDHRDRQAQCMHGLGQVYLQRAVKSSRSGMDFVKAAGLFNSAHSRSAGPRQAELESEIADVVIEFVKCSGGKRVPSRDEVKKEISRRKDLLKAFRERVSRVLESVDSGLNPDHVSTDVKQSTYMQRAEKTQQLLLEIRDEIKNTLSSMINECKQVYGEPPCKYAFVGLGSLARVEATPYSDIESAILLEKEDPDTKSYFRNLSYLLYIKVVNIGETILPALAIKSLNNFLSGKTDDWFRDFQSPRGMSFDGAMPWASKTPLGREATGTKPALELMATPESMAKFQDEDISVKMGYNLADIMLRVTLIDGDSSLVAEYDDLVQRALSKTHSKMNHHAPLSIGQYRGCEQFIHDGVKYHPDTLEITANTSSPGGILDAKKHLYRIPSLLVSDLALLYGINETSPWNVVTQMRKKELISSEGERNLKICLSLASEARLKTYMANKGQKESISALPTYTSKLPPNAQQEEQKIFHFLDKNKLFQLLSTACALSEKSESLCQQLYKCKTPVDFSSLLGDSSMLSCDNLINGLLWLRLLNFSKAKECWQSEPFDSPYKAKCLNNEAYVCGLMHDHNAAIQCLQQLLTLDARKSFVQRPACLNNLAIELRSVGKYKEAMKCIEEAIELHILIHGSDPVMSLINYNFNRCQLYFLLGDTKKGCEEGDKWLQQIHILRKDMEPYLNMAVMYSAFAVVLSENNMADKAQKAIACALHICTKLVGAGTEHPLFINIYLNTGRVHELNGKYPDALYEYEKSREVLRSAFGDEKHPDRISIFNNLGNVWIKLGDVKLGIEYLEKALQECDSVYGEKPVYLAANIYNNMSIALKRKATNKDKALECLNKAMHIMDELFGIDYPHPLTCDILNNLGAIHQDLGDFILAKETYQKAAKMNKAIYGPNGLHPSVSTVYCNLGDVYQKENDLKKAEENYTLAVNIDRNIWNNRYVTVNAVDLSSSLYGLSTILKAQGKKEEAHAIILEAFQVIQERSSDSSALIIVLLGMSQDLKEMGYDADNAAVRVVLDEVYDVLKKNKSR